MGVRAQGAPDTPRGRREPSLPRPPRVPVVALMPPLPVVDLQMPPVRGELVAIDNFDLEASLGEEMDLDSQLVAVHRGEAPLPPQPTLEMSGTIVAAGPAPPTPNGVAQPSGVQDPARGSGNEILAGRVGAAAGLRSQVVQHFIGDSDANVRARAPKVRPKRLVLRSSRQNCTVSVGCVHTLKT